MKSDNISRVYVPDAFSRGFVDESGRMKAPRYGRVTENMRVNKRSLVPRKWFATRINMGSATPIRWIGTYGDKVAYSYNGHIYLTNDSVTLATDLGVMNIGPNTPTVGPAITSYGYVSWSVKSYYLMVFNGWIPRVRDGTTLSNITTIPLNYDPKMAEVFTNARWISDGSGSIIRSSPVIAATPSDIFEFNHATDTVTKNFTSNVTAIKSSISTLYVFTEESIHSFSNRYTDGSVRKIPVFNEIYRGPTTWSSQSVTSAGNMVFFLTKENKIKTIGYASWIVNPRVGDLSSTMDISIRDWIENNLDPDRHLATARYIDSRDIVKFNVRSTGSLTNDIAIVYDLRSKTFFIDKGKTFGTSGVSVGGKNFVWSSTTGKLFVDEYGKTDDGAAITCKRKTIRFDFGKKTEKKILREVILSGRMNLDTEISINVITDGAVAKTDVANKSLVSNDIVGIKTENVKYPFRKVISKWSLFSKWYSFELEFTATGTNLDFELSTLDLWVTGTSEKNDLFEK